MAGRALARFSRIISLGLLTVAVLAPKPVHADPVREFVMSASYGALAGTLVGAATLAFSDKPGDNLNRVARGASIGLYAGILLGLYVVYGVPSGDEEEMPVTSLSPGTLEGVQGSIALTQISSNTRARLRVYEPPRLQIMPLINDENGLEGAAARYDLLRF